MSVRLLQAEQPINSDSTSLSSDASYPDFDGDSIDDGNDSADYWDKPALAEKSFAAANGINIPIAIVFIVGLTAGSGTVSAGNNIADIGWFGIPLLVALALVNSIAASMFSKCFLLAIESQSALKNDNRKAYTNIVRVAMGPTAEAVSQVLFYVCSFLATAVYLLIAADFLALIVKSIAPSTPFLSNYRLWLALYAVLLYPLTLLATPKDIKFVPVIAVVTAVIPILLTIIKITIDFSSGAYQHAQPREVTASSFFNGLGGILFSLASVPFLPNIQADMKKPADFAKACSYGYLVVVAILMSSGAVVYFILGDLARDNVMSNTLLASDTGWIKILPYTSIVLLSLHFAFGFLLLFNPISQEIEGSFMIPQDMCWQRCCIRGFLMLFSLIVAEAVPDFKVLMTICGGTLLGIMSFILPSLCYWRMNHNLSLLIKASLVLLQIVVMICLMATFYSGVREIVNLYTYE